MAETQSDTPQTNWKQLWADQEQWKAQKERKFAIILMRVLLSVGIPLVLLAGPLGSLYVQKFGPYDSTATLAAAETLRGIGFLVFIGGVAERIILVIREQKPPAVSQ